MGWLYSGRWRRGFRRCRGITSTSSSPDTFRSQDNKICALQRDPVMEFLFKDGEFIVEHQAEYLLAWVREQ